MTLRSSGRTQLLFALGAIPEAAVERWRSWHLSSVVYDLRRSLRAAPGQAGAVVAILALAIGANTAVFSVFRSVLLRPLPYAEPDRIVRIFDANTAAGNVRSAPSPGNFLDWQARTRSFTALTAWYAGKPRTLEADAEAAKIPVADVTPAFFDVFAAEPAVGRAFHGTDRFDRGKVAVMSHALWLERFGGDSGVVGREILLNGERHTVLAVMPPTFDVPHRDVGFWLPWDLRVSYARLAAVPRDFRFLEVAGRMRAGVAPREAWADIDSVARALAAEHPRVNAGWGVSVVPHREDVVGRFGRTVLTLLAAVGFVLLIACTNVANLTLARMHTRAREFAVRAALGAPASRLVRGVLAENLFLALLAGALGAVIAVVGVRVLIALAPPGVPRIGEIGVDAGSIAFGLGVSLLAGVVAGLVPALHARRGLDNALLREGARGGGAGRRRAMARPILVAAQVAMAFGLLVGAGLMTHSLARMLGTGPGYDAKNMLVVRVFPDEARFDAAERVVYFDRVYDALRALPGVSAVGATTGLPLNRFNNAPRRPYWLAADGRPAAGAPSATIMMTSTGYFGAMRIPIVQGRNFGSEDRAGAPPVAVVTHTLARKLWGERSGVGDRVMIDFDGRDPRAYEVVGVAGDVRSGGPRSEPEAGIYLPHAQVAYAQMNVVVRTSGDPLALAGAARRAVLAIDPRQPVHSVTSMDRLIGESVAQERFGVFMAAVLAGLALVLAVSGIYAVASRMVAERTREIGVRVALGASRRAIVRLVGAQTLAMVGAGVAVGLLNALLIARGLRGLLFEVGAVDPLALGGALALVSAAVVVASVVPVWRALRVAPIEALRRE